MKITDHETEIVGKWKFENGKVVNDDTANRIEWLIVHVLKKVASGAGGWDTLYQDPGDKRYWELTYPHSEMQGGGAPMLSVLGLAEAQAKYGI